VHRQRTNDELVISIMTNSRCLSRIFRVFALVLTASLSSSDAKTIVIHHFQLKAGPNPQNGLIADAQGNLYGVTATGGENSCAARSCGVVFELSLGVSGAWTERIIYDFKGGTADGSSPATQLAFDANGDLFGATALGGTNGFGTIFELIPAHNKKWTEKIIYNFATQDGTSPGSVLTLDRQGNIYGSMTNFGANGYGTVFVISPQANGAWNEKILWQFSGPDGRYPYGGVVLDSKGNIYGTTNAGGAYNFGTVYTLYAGGGGNFVERTLYSFKGQGDGASPIAPLSIDAQNNVYGTTSNTYILGAAIPSVAFGFIADGSKWKVKVLYIFGTSRFDGYNPSGLTLDARGNLYGTTTYGGSGCNNPGCGNVFKLTRPRTGEEWTETILHQFEGAEDGSESTANVLLYNTQVYGATRYGGGRSGYGVVFAVSH
jgi:hypothetical protein